MSLYKPKNTPYWHFDFQLSGVRFHGSTGTTVKAKARMIEAQRRNDAASGDGNRKRQPMTLDAAAGRYFVEIGEHQPSAGTTEYQLDNLIDGLGKDTLLAEITDNEIAEYVARRRAHVANASVNRETQLLKRVLRRAETTWKADTGEAIDWRPVMLPEPVGRIRELRSAEETRLFKHLGKICTRWSASAC
ncbi:MAG: hypothetical protein IID48_12070 [Proteobacteria bacterium]|nr:hypothetical protein [Pseudomonadota bacterium]